MDLSVNFTRDEVIESMKNLNVYKPEFDTVIDVYIGLVDQYRDAMHRFEESGRLFETETAAGGTKKSATFGSMENLRKDILAYSDRLCLNPKSYYGLKQVETVESVSLADQLEKIAQTL